jgi:hypothetical protein
LSKKPKQRFILNLKLKTEPYQEDVLDNRFEIGRKMYNALLGKALKRYNELVKTKQWRENQAALSNLYKTTPAAQRDTAFYKLCKPYLDTRNAMLKKYRLSEYSLHEDVKLMQRIFRKNIDAFTAQKIASRVWIAINDKLFGDGEKVHFKKYGTLSSLEGKSNGTGIRYSLENNLFLWNRLKIPVMLNVNNQYEINALRNKICYCRIKRIFVKNKYKYILQLVLEGVPPIKINKATGEIKNSIGVGTAGIDIGTQTIAYVNDYDVKLLELAPRVQNIENVKRRTQRYMDRSKRANDPQNFNKDGTVKKGKLTWHYSKHYIKAKNRLKDLYRCQADIRRLDHNIMANEIIKNCNTVYVEEMNFKALQKKSKNTEKNEHGKFKRKKRFGKSLAKKAPAMFLTILENKLKAKGGLYYEVNTREVKASQYNHLDRKYNKKKLSKRWNYFNYNGTPIKVQRDMYSAYLIKNVNANLSSINNEQCTIDFDKFLKLHNKEVQRLQNQENLSSIGI